LQGIFIMKQRSAIKDISILTPVMLWILLCQPPVFAQEVDSASVAAAGAGATSAGDATTSVVQPEAADLVADPATVKTAEVSAPTEAPARIDQPVKTEATTDSTAESTADVAPAESKSSGAAALVAAAAVTAVSTSDLLAMFNKQQAQLDAQKQRIALLSSQLDDESRQEKETIAKQAQQIEEQRTAMLSMQTQIDQFTKVKAQDLSDEEVKLRARLETLESSIQASRDSASTAFDEKSFPGSTTIPGTNAAMRFGGFVKMNLVETFNPLGSLDRFIAGTIPVPQQSSSPRTSMTASQSRLNWDLRDRTKFGVMRAFIEGDFAGDSDSDTFRLRHAYGQFRVVLAGKTWSTFMDVDASPEEIDFEGINGRINVRQPQIRYFPKVGKDWDLLFALEDPNPEITGGDAISQWPDVVVSARRTWFERWHVKTSGVLRQITGTWDGDPTGGTDDKVTGWGVSISGKTSTRFWNKLALDNIMFQFNVGDGIGRYVNDTNTIGGEDAVFGPTGSLEALPMFAGYVAYQHWWTESMRSTLNLSWVDINNSDFEPGEAYKRTYRSAINVIWSPIARIDLGGEFIWGRRENKDDENATASQIQLSTKYRF
jgi:hypothetical protein